MSPTSRALAATLAASLFGCNYRIAKSVDKGAADGVSAVQITAQDLDPAFTPGYDVIARKILNPACVECHSPDFVVLGGASLDSYLNVKKWLAMIKSDVEDDSMPKDRPPLNAKQKALLFKWIAKGAPEQGLMASQTQQPPGLAEGPLPSPQDASEAAPARQLKLDYATVKSEVLEPACVQCHNSERKDASVDLSSLELIRNQNAKVAKSVHPKTGGMPKKGKFTAEQRKLLLDWLAAGAPEKSERQMAPPAEKETTGPSYTADPEALVAASKHETLARGKYFFDLGLCANCHTVDPEKPLAGGLPLESKFGTYFSTNISSDPETGIGKWTSADFLRAMREGIGPGGTLYYPAFPFTSYSKMTDEDILAIRSYIMTLPPTVQKNRDQIPKLPFPLNKFPMNPRLSLVGWRTLNFGSPSAFDELSFRTASGPYTPLISRSLSWNRGAYLVEGPMHCAQCHTPRDFMGGMIKDQWFGGSIEGAEGMPAPNITPDRETGLGSWTARDWIKYLNEGVNPQGVKSGGEMRRVISEATSQLTDSDKAAVIEYMMSVAPVKNEELARKLREANH